MNSKDYFLVTGIIFGLIAMGHLARLVNQSVFIIGSWHLPPFLSLVAAVVAGYLSYQGFVLAGVIKKK